LRQPHQHHDDGHPQRGAQQHNFAPFAIGKAAPEGRGHGGEQEGNAEYQPGPHIQGAARHAKLFDVEREKGHDQAKGGAG
jgi:hypothetical protein